MILYYLIFKYYLYIFVQNQFVKIHIFCRMGALKNMSKNVFKNLNIKKCICMNIMM